MAKQYTIILTTLIVCLLSGCKWVDDFRARVQPQYLEQPERPTLNRESEDYKGDDTHQTEDEERDTPLPSIDGLSTIPELPEYPAGAGLN